MQIIENNYISIEGVEKLLQGLSPNKASGPDEISPKILKELHHEIAPILTLIFNLSLETGVIGLPLDWRSADVVPVYKKGSKSKACNYIYIHIAHMYSFEIVRTHAGFKYHEPL